MSPSWPTGYLHLHKLSQKNEGPKVKRETLGARGMDLGAIKEEGGCLSGGLLLFGGRGEKGEKDLF